MDINRRAGNLGDDSSPEDIFAQLAALINQDSMSDMSFGIKLENTYLSKLCADKTAGLPDSHGGPVSLEDFVRQIKIAIDDCFNGTVVYAGLGSLCYIMPDRTAFKLQIVKL